MKQLLHHIVFCCMVVLCFTACDKDDALCVSGSGGDGNSIILDLASASLPVTRATVQATGAEIAVSHLDVLIFKEDETKVWHERVRGSAGGSGKITLSAKRSDFAANEAYWVYLIANSTADVSVFETKDFDLGDLKGMVQEDERIHVTGLDVIGAPQTFLMDGVAYPKKTNEPETVAPVVLNNGKEADNTELQVVLRRAAAKIVVKISKGQYVEFDNSPAASNAGYYLRNMPYTTSVVPPVSMDEDYAKLRTPDLFNGDYFDWTPDVITVTAYAYAHVWEDASTLEKEVRLIVNIPMNYTPHNEDGSTGDPQFMESSYYQIPVSAAKKLNRNTCYEVLVTVNAPGGSNPLKPIELTDIAYSVYDWEKEQINVGGEDNRPAYLTLNEYEMEMHNMEEDNTTLEFASSSEVTAEITKVYYINKFGQEQELEKTNNRNNPDEWGEQDGWDYKNRCTIKITPDENITGNINIYGDIPGNNAVRFIEFTVRNKEGISRPVTVAQYPLTYITNVEGYYSYRDDFKINDSRPTTYDYMGDRVYGISLATRSISNWNGNYDYEVSSGFGWFEDASNGFFRSKVVTKIVAGKSTILHYYWNSRGVLSTSESGEYNGRLYHITITSTSDKYTIGNPRQIRDETTGLLVTDPGTDNAELVSPSFMIASSLGGFMLGAGNLTLDNSANSLRVAREHCANYVEVTHDGTIYDDWRLPTRAELEIIMNFQGKEDEDADAIDYLLNAKYYYSANGRVENSKSNMNGTGVRCIRDAFDTQK